MARGKWRDPTREVWWRDLLARHDGSGLNVRAYCRREGVSEPAFYAWRRTLRQRDAQVPVGSDARVPDARPQATRPAFVPLLVRPEHPGGDITLELRGGRIMRLPLSMPPAHLAAIVGAIEGVA